MSDKKPEEITEEKPASVPLSGTSAGEKELNKKIAELEKQKNEYLAGWQRSRADLLNYKKEEMERVGEFLKYANEEFVLRVLPILDNFEIATRLRSADGGASARQEKEDDVVQGFLQIKKQIQDFLKSQGVEEVKSVGEKFDPNLHEAVEEIEMKDKEKSAIVEEVQKGYKINGRLLRPAKVRVTK